MLAEQPKPAAAPCLPLTTACAPQRAIPYPTLRPPSNCGPAAARARPSAPRAARPPTRASAPRPPSPPRPPPRPRPTRPPRARPPPRAGRPAPPAAPRGASPPPRAAGALHGTSHSRVSQSARWLSHITVFCCLAMWPLWKCHQEYAEHTEQDRQQQSGSARRTLLGYLLALKGVDARPLVPIHLPLLLQQPRIAPACRPARVSALTSKSLRHCGARPCQEQAGTGVRTQEAPPTAVRTHAHTAGPRRAPARTLWSLSHVCCSPRKHQMTACRSDKPLWARLGQG